METKKPAWTTQQQLAIETVGRNVLVTASAGTGKTAVLSERCAKLLADTNNPTGVSQILVLTFTEAAAQEMSSRIGQKLHEMLKGNPSSYLRHQLLLLDSANISTIHSFCKKIITEYFYLLGIDPAFRMIDPDEQKLLKTEILNQVIEYAWSDDSLAGGLRELLQGRNFQDVRTGILSNVIGISEFLDSVISRETVLFRGKIGTKEPPC